MISEWIAAILLLFGAGFMLIAGIGILRFTDLYLRMHAATKAPSLGVFLMVVGIIVFFGEILFVVKGTLIILFIFMTTPVGSHMLSRTAHLMNVQKSKETLVDELSDYDEKLNSRKK